MSKSRNKVAKFQVTDRTVAALKIVQKHGRKGLLPGQFATYMWPDAQRRPAGGNSQHRGGDNMAVCAGGLLGRLRRRKLIDGPREHPYVTPAGLTAIEESRRGKKVRQARQPQAANKGGVGLAARKRARVPSHSR